ncbi:MAG: hypothetical protein ACOYD7_03585 [Raoultibacter sp.]|jgi:hypothetical protein
MSQRNPMNDRYSEENKGKTRKSAASAKPKAKAASSVRMQGTAPAKQTKAQKKEAKAQRRAEEKSVREFEGRNYAPNTPEYKNWRKAWWASIIFAGIFLASSFIIQNYFPENGEVYITVLIGTYVFIAFGLWIEFWKLRRMRNAHYESLKSVQTKEQRQKEKEQKKAEREAKAAAESGEPAEKPASKLSFSGLKNLTKKSSDSDTKGK